MMEWSRYTLREVAPSIPCRNTPDPDATLWHLGLDQIEGHTGAVLAKHRVPVSEAGTSTFHFDQSHVLYSKLRPYLNKVVVPDEPGIATTELIPLKPNPHLVRREFLAYYLRSPVFLAYASQYVTGAKMPRVILDRFWTHEIALPTPSEQRRIVETLDRADRLRRLHAEADAKSNRILPALLVRALGGPANWGSEPRYRPLGDFVDPVSGATPSKTTERFWSGEVPWVSPKDMKVDFLSDSQDHVSQAAVDETNLNVIEQGSTLIVVRGMILARDVPVAINRNPVTINQDMKALVPKTTEITGAYIWATLHLARRKLQTLVRTAGHGTRKLDTPDLMQFPIPAPDTDRLKQVASIVEHHRLAVEQRQKSKKMLDRVFAVALHKAFDGSLTASWRNRHMEDLFREMKVLERTAVDAAP